MSASLIVDKLGAMKRDPRGGWTIVDVTSLCQGLGIKIVLPRPEASHCVLMHDKVDGLLTLPAHRPIKPLYIRLLVQLAESVLDR